MTCRFDAHFARSTAAEQVVGVTIVIIKEARP
jgi:hypothetical protein